VVLKRLAQNSNLKMITGERAIGGTEYLKKLAQNSNLNTNTRERAIVFTCY